jgi:hypothetical protein
MNSSMAELTPRTHPDPGTGDEPAKEEVPGCEGEGGGDTREDVNDKRQHHQLPSSEAIGELTEEQRSCACSGHQTVPKPAMIRQWKRDHGSPSRRAGDLRAYGADAEAGTHAPAVLSSGRTYMGCSGVSSKAIGPMPAYAGVGAALPHPRTPVPVHQCRVKDALELPTRLRRGGDQAIPDSG